MKSSRIFLWVVASVFLMWSGLLAADIQIAQMVSTISPVSAPNLSGKPALQASLKPLLNIAWDNDSKTTNFNAGERSAHFSFNFTNISLVDVTILSVRPSCGCTTAQLPPLPWVVSSSSSGQIGVTVNLTGKSGTVFKTVTIGTDKGSKELSVKIALPTVQPVLPDDNSLQQSQTLTTAPVVISAMSDASRQRSLEIAKVDRQAVFRDDCANCHAKPTEDKYGRELFNTACSICHEGEHRASMVPNLHVLNVPTSFEFWQTWISQGKPDSLMPAFAKAAGGPLTDAQIASVAAYLAAAIPSRANDFQ